MPITPDQLAKSNTEDGHQMALLCWCAQSGFAELRWLFAIPNGGLRNPVTAARLKATGVKAGAPDLFLPLPMHLQYEPEYYGLFIEMKRPKTTEVAEGRISAEQQEWIDFLNQKGYWCEVCYGWEAARDTILKYLGKI